MFTKKTFPRSSIILLIPVTLAAVYLAFSSLLLQRAGEYLPLAVIAERQDRDRGLFGPALYERTFWYKKYLYQHHQPETVAMGSTRVLQFRGALFKGSFFNLGSAHDMDDGIEMARALFTDKPPKQVILGVDFWWFLPANAGRATARSPQDVSIRASDLFKPLQWLLGGRLGPNDILRILENRSPDIGMTALLHRDGFDHDGSYHYNAILTGDMKNYDSGFKESLRRIRSREKFFAPADGVSEEQWQKFSDFVNFLQQKKINIVMFLPPLAPTIIDTMEERQKNYAYLAEVRRRMTALAQQKKIQFSDFHDPRYIGSHDCEFIDGIHGGEILYNRLLLHMALKSPVLAESLDLPKIGWNIAHYAGQASLLGGAETDFLGIGCKKSGTAATEK